VGEKCSWLSSKERGIMLKKYSISQHNIIRAPDLSPYTSTKLGAMDKIFPF
jgi:hypothetical protein